MKKFRNLFSEDKGLLTPDPISFTKSPHGGREKQKREKEKSAISEQHREEGRFKPTVPRYVKSKGVGPRPTVDSTDVKLKEGIEPAASIAARTYDEKPNKEPIQKIKKEEIDIPKDAPSVEVIAKKHGVSVDYIQKQLEDGMKVEAEHGKNKGSEREIALDHLNEKPDYYVKLKKYVESVQDKLYAQHQELRKKSGLPHPDYYKELGQSYNIKNDQERYAKQAEIRKKHGIKEDTELDEMSGANMDTRAIHSHLKKQGWMLSRTSGAHDVFTHPNSKEHIPVPRHKKLKAPLVLGILKKSKVNEESEMKKTLNEISAELHKKYQSAARKELPALAKHAQSGEYKDIAQNIYDKRIKGMTRSSALQLRDKMAKHTPKNEEVEQIDEVSDETLSSYKEKAKASADKLEGQKQFGKALKRRVGVLQATGKQVGRAGEKIGQLAKEEVESLEEGRLSQRHPLEGHEYHKKTDAELIHIAKDAHKAAEAMKGHNTQAENKYRDQANDSATVRYFRQKSGMPDWYKKKYGHVKEEVELDEGENKQVKGGDPCWKGYEMVGKKMKNGREVPNCVPVKEAKDDVGEMIKDKLQIIINRAQEMHDHIGDATDMPEWVKSKITLAQDYVSTACDYSCGKEQLGEETETKKHPFVAVHAKKGTHETHGSTSYEAAQNAAKHWKMKSTAGIDVHRADVKHVAEETEQLDEISKEKAGKYFDANAKEKRPGPSDFGISNKDARKAHNRIVGGNRALDRMFDSSRKKLKGYNEETNQKDNLPFDPDKKSTQKAIPGKHGAGYSTARHLARQAMQKQVEKMKPIKESLSESRKAEIVKEIMKKKKNEKETSDEKYQKDPVLSNEIMKV